MFSTKKSKINYIGNKTGYNKKVPLIKNKKLEYKIRILMNLSEDERLEKNKLIILETKILDGLKDTEIKLLNTFPDIETSFRIMRDETSENQAVNYYLFNVDFNIKIDKNISYENIYNHLSDCILTTFAFGGIIEG